MVNTGLRPDEVKLLEFRDVEIVEDEWSGQKILEIEVRGKRGVGYCKSMPGAVRPFERLRDRDRDRPAADASNDDADEPLLVKPGPTDRLFPNEFKKMFNRILNAKRWVLANLARWGWFTAADPAPRPVFHMLSEDAGMGLTPVSMGHDDGVLTINVTEAEPAERIRRREYLGEKLRTMTAHIRHEFGHFIFGRLMKREGFPEAFRGMFGDEHADYATALDVYYRNGPPQDWQSRHVTAYAASHPLEDWAESFSHLLHLTDIVDSFAATAIADHDLIAPEYDAYAETDAGRLVTLGINLGMALNHVNRSMELEDIYPFVLTPTVRGKLAFVRGHIHSVH